MKLSFGIEDETARVRRPDRRGFVIRCECQTRPKAANGVQKPDVARPPRDVEDVDGDAPVIGGQLRILLTRGFTERGETFPRAVELDQL